MNILLIEPDFPIPAVSRNHHDFLPVGLLKIASYHRAIGDDVRLLRGNKILPDFYPDIIKITSLFTYWSNFVWNSVKFYREAYPKAKIIVGGIYASLMPEHSLQSGCDEVFVGVDDEAEKYQPAYDLVDVKYQIIHTSRGCIRKCDYCGTWKIEPEFHTKSSIKYEICSNKIIFYDNNLLANENIEKILEELKDARHNGRVVQSESQCGIDGRLLTPKLARMLKQARFVAPRIAWDFGLKQKDDIKNQIDMLVEAGYNPRSMYVFMVYNYDISYEEMVQKIELCLKWGVQVADCRFRPLDQTFDNYSPFKKQTNNDYFIHSEWSDELIKGFRRKVRQQNIMVRYNFDHYSVEMEKEGQRRRQLQKTLNQ